MEKKCIATWVAIKAAVAIALSVVGLSIIWECRSFGGDMILTAFAMFNAIELMIALTKAHEN